MSLVSLLGEELLTADGKRLATATALENKVVGLYFSAHWCPPCRGFTPDLAKWYTTSLSAKGLEVVFISSDQDQASFDEYFAEMPWKALPFDKRGEKDALSKKFQVKGIPTLVILDADGTVLTKDGRSTVSEDPTGEDFPWQPKPWEEILGNAFVGQGGAVLDKQAVEGKVLGLYFSAHWCPPCRGFTPKLAEWYKAVKPTLPDFEVVFVSSDHDEEAFTEYFAEMPWLALPYIERKREKQLSTRFEVDGIPTFVIVDAAGKTINTNAGGIVSGDPAGKQFPWHPKPLKDLADDTEGINDSPSLIVFLDGADEATAAPIKTTLNALAQEVKDQKGDEAMLFFYGGVSAAGPLRQLRSLAKQSVTPKKHEHPLTLTARPGVTCDGCKKSVTSTHTATNADGILATASYDPHHEAAMRYYCGRTVGQAGYSDPCGDCDGDCGPNNGCQCVACSKLDASGTAPMGYCCKDCDFDFCSDCNATAVDDPSCPVSGVLFDFDKELYYLADGVDFASAASVRDFVDKFYAGSLQGVDL